MYICLCNPFTDKDLDKALQNHAIPKKKDHIYEACTAGQKPCCGSCLCEIQDRIDEHNEETLLMAAE